jgi:hypothetical protein
VGQSKSPATLAARCGILAVWFYFIQGTVFPWYLHVPGLVMSLLLFLVPAVTTVVVATGGGSWRWSWLVVLFAFALGICMAEEPGSAGLHWLGEALLMIAVGPVILNPTAVEVRSSAWRLTVKGLTTLTGIFVVWYVLHLPSFGMYFTSFMNQSMLLGPIAGLGVVIASARALHGRSWRWGLLAAFGLVPLLASGSRLAALATCAAGCSLLIRRKPILGGVFALLVVLAIVRFLATTGNKPIDNDSVSFTNALAKKGIGDSRSELWQARIDEFKSSPLIGIGISMGRDSGTFKNAQGSIRVEPGSSYLAILSMTGALGTIAFFSALGMLLYGFYTNQSMPPLEKDILSVVGILLAVHGVAEGWILGFGHPLCFLFWLWLGNFGDAARQSVQPVANRRLRSPIKVRLVQRAPATR